MILSLTSPRRRTATKL